MVQLSVSLSRDVDVVVGAGIAVATAACRLVKNGRSALAIDPEKLQPHRMLPPAALLMSVRLSRRSAARAGPLVHHRRHSPEA